MITLIDYASIAWRNWHATKDGGQSYDLSIEQMEFYTQDGNAIVCLEGGNLKRKEAFPEYKANRKEQPSEAHDAIRAVLEQVESWFVPVAKVPGYEADDVIATLAKQANFDEVRIISRDKDLYQLLGPNVVMETNTGRIGEAECVRKFGVRPDQMRDWLALVGDASDNVPGCPSCGPGRARDLLVEFGSIEGIRASLDRVTEVRGVGKKTADALAEWDPAMALELVTLNTELDVSLEALLPELFIVEDAQ